ncbi:hypothetical protein Ancab_033597 [Ancistrocladus abbreviatus]
MVAKDITHLCQNLADATVWEEYWQLQVFDQNFFGHLYVAGNIPLCNPRDISDLAVEVASLGNSAGKSNHQCMCNGRPLLQELAQQQWLRVLLNHYSTMIRQSNFHPLQTLKEEHWLSPIQKWSKPPNLCMAAVEPRQRTRTYGSSADCSEATTLPEPSKPAVSVGRLVNYDQLFMSNSSVNKPTMSSISAW